MSMQGVLLQGVICFESVMADAEASGDAKNGKPIICKPTKQVRSDSHMDELCFECVFDLVLVLVVSLQLVSGLSSVMMCRSKHGSPTAQAVFSLVP